MGDDPTAVALVILARPGADPTACDEIVERYTPLAWSICAQLCNDHREKLQIPMGSIGPWRARRLERLRKYSGLPGFGEAYLHWAGGEHDA